MRKHSFANPRSRRRGTTLLEFALIVPIFVALLLGMIQFGIYLNAAAGVVSLAREGARRAAVDPKANSASIQAYLATSGVCPAQLRADHFGYPPADPQNPQNGPKSTGGVKVEYFNTAGTSAARSVGGVVRVTITYDMSDKLIVGPAVTGAVLNPNYTTSASFRVEQ